MSKWCFLVIVYLTFSVVAAERFCAQESQEIPEQEVETNLFESPTDAEGWTAERNCKTELLSGTLSVKAEKGEPIITKYITPYEGDIRLTAKIRTKNESNAVLYWTTKGSPGRHDGNRIVMPLVADYQWHEYEFKFSVTDALLSLTFKFVGSEGLWEIDDVRLFRTRLHPIRVLNCVPFWYEENGTKREMLRYTIQNHSHSPLTIEADGLEKKANIPARKTVDLLVPIHATGNLATVNLALRVSGYPDIRFPVFAYRPEGQTEWLSRSLDPKEGNLFLDVAPDACMARIRRGQEVVGIIAPLVHRNGVIPIFTPSVNQTEMETAFDSDDVSLKISFQKNVLRFLIEDRLSVRANNEPPEKTPPLPLEGPVVRLFGTLQGGLLPGVEFLGKGDTSSSVIDIEPPHNERHRPPPDWVTIPFAVLETDKIGAVLSWKDTTLRPTFSAPNRIDWAEEHRFSLIGTKIDATLNLIPPSAPDDSAALYALRKYTTENKFPPPPNAPRSPQEQREFVLGAIRNPFQSEDGASWGYAAEHEWPRKPYADILSVLVRLTDKVPRVVEIEPGGSAIANDAIYFMTNRVELWKKQRGQAIQEILQGRNPDGTFFYRTRFPEFESAITSPGYTAIRALEILEYARLMGDDELFRHVTSSLDAVNATLVPRGGFYRDSPLHTPDLLTAATLVWTNTWAYEYSGNEKYLQAAKKFALLGLPFVYLWGDKEIMCYVTVPKFGATERQLPTGFGQSQTNVGILYAYALLQYEKYDTTLDWKRVATGILYAIEKMQYTDDVGAGAVPAVFSVRDQQRLSWRMNPASLMMLRFALEEKPGPLTLVADRKERIVSPYPVRISPRGFDILDVPKTQTYQILRNGFHIINLKGSRRVPID